MLPSSAPESLYPTRPIPSTSVDSAVVLNQTYPNISEQWYRNIEDLKAYLSSLSGKQWSINSKTKSRRILACSSRGCPVKINAVHSRQRDQWHLTSFRNGVSTHSGKCIVIPTTSSLRTSHSHTMDGTTSTVQTQHKTTVSPHQIATTPGAKHTFTLPALSTSIQPSSIPSTQGPPGPPAQVTEAVPVTIQEGASLAEQRSKLVRQVAAFLGRYSLRLETGPGGVRKVDPNTRGLGDLLVSMAECIGRVSSSHMLPTALRKLHTQMGRSEFTGPPPPQAQAWQAGLRVSDSGDVGRRLLMYTHALWKDLQTMSLKTSGSLHGQPRKAIDTIQSIDTLQSIDTISALRRRPHILPGPSQPLSVTQQHRSGQPHRSGQQHRSGQLIPRPAVAGHLTVASVPSAHIPAPTPVKECSGLGASGPVSMNKDPSSEYKDPSSGYPLAEGPPLKKVKLH